MNEESKLNTCIVAIFQAEVTLGSAAVLVRTEREAGNTFLPPGCRNRRDSACRRLADGGSRSQQQGECLIS